MNWQDILKIKDESTGETLVIEDLSNFMVELRKNMEDVDLGEGLIDSERKSKVEVSKRKGSTANPPINNDMGCAIRVIARNEGEELIRFDIRVSYVDGDTNAGRISTAIGNELSLTAKDSVKGKDGLLETIVDAVKDSVNRSVRV